MHHICIYLRWLADWLDRRSYNVFISPSNAVFILFQKSLDIYFYLFLKCVTMICKLGWYLKYNKYYEFKMQHKTKVVTLSSVGCDAENPSQLNRNPSPIAQYCSMDFVDYFRYDDFSFTTLCQSHTSQLYHCPVSCDI